MRAHRLILALALCAPAPARRAPAPRALPRYRPSRCRIWCGSRACPSPPYRRTASASPTPCERPTWTPTRDAPPSGCSTSASATPRPCGSPIWRPTRARPSGARDGRFLYYLSNRSGSSQVWRLTPGNDPTSEPTQVTNLPLDVGSFRVSPKGDRVFVTVDVYRDCPTLACTKERLDTAAHSQAARSALRPHLRAALGYVERRPALATLLPSRSMPRAPRAARRSISPRDSTATCRRSPSAAARTTP